MEENGLAPPLPKRKLGTSNTEGPQGKEERKGGGGGACKLCNAFKFGATISLSVSSMLIHIFGALETYKKTILDFSIFIKVQICDRKTKGVIFFRGVSNSRD